MRLRRFTGADPRAALVRVKETLGPEAVILATRALADGGVEITAAVDLECLGAADAAADAAPAARVESAELAAITRELGAMAARVARIDRALAPALAPADGGLDDEARSVAERLALNGTAPALAETAARSFAQARRDGVLPAARARREHRAPPVPIRPPAEPRVTAFVGPTGLGKTTTDREARGARARRAARRRSRDGRHASHRRGGAARHLRAPARRADATRVRDGGARAALAAFADRDVVYVDTAG
jgi:flagellar biosynthesis protein FlhF